LSLAYKIEDEPMLGLHSLGETVLSQKGYRVDRASALNEMWALRAVATESDRLHF
jgi:hypothetical protein